MKFGSYIQELFSELGNYVPRGRTGAAAATLSGLTLFTGCNGSERKSGLEVGDKYRVEADFAGDENEYVILDTEYSGLPDENVGKRKASPSDIVLAAGDSIQARRLVECVDGKTIVVKRLRKEGYYKTTGGEIRYNAAPGDIEIYDAKDGKSYRFPCDDKATEKPHEEPAKKPYRSQRPASKPAAQPVKSEPPAQPPVVNITIEQPVERVIERTVYIEAPQPEPVVFVEEIYVPVPVPVPMPFFPGPYYRGRYPYGAHTVMLSPNQRRTFVPARRGF